ncbi:interleukin-7 receptor subunit alpha [Leuresthes tenuis]|uniref:interleukin-7 receptor subunit alpha n=1 Tax=Leuresthes tenuis TaxID=355514 RepID=UPI003B5138BC
MRIGRRIAALLLLLAAGAEAQSGDTDSEPRISCFSHISMRGCSLTCELLDGSDHNEDDEDGDCIESMALCYFQKWVQNSRKTDCVEAPGNTVASKELSPVQHLNLTVHLKRGGRIRAPVDLKTIVRPRSPRVQNVTFNRTTNTAVIYIQTPYHHDYLSLENQMFQLHIWTAGTNMTQNISSKDFLQMDLQHLHRPSEYGVRVRSIPQDGFQGSWSEWSETFSFRRPAAERPDPLARWQVTACTVTVCLVSVAVVTSSAFIIWKNRIFTYMWPSVPHPKQTVVQICQPHKGLLLSLSPEVFSSLRVFPPERRACAEAEPAASPAHGSQSSSTHSCDCRSTTSVSTEELELSALLSRSSSDGEDSVPSSSPSPGRILRPLTPPPELNEVESGVNQQEEAYVTMSSFYQIK